MSSKIIVAGAGHGGLSAAYTLAKNGYDVTVYEKRKEEDLGYEWHDYFDMKSWAAAGFSLPAQGVIDRVPLAYYGPDPEIPPLYQPDQPGYDMYMPRKEIYRHIMKHCKAAGVKFVFECTIDAPIILGSRVVGIKTDKGDFLADLVIDAAGIDSPIRMQLPDSFGIDKDYKEYDYLYVYRGIYNRVEGIPNEDPMYRVYLSCDKGGNIGLKWCVTYDDYVDVLIGRSNEFGQDEVDEIIQGYRKDQPWVGEDVIRGGQFVRIPIRQSPGIMVADGYAGVGDTVAMTMPIMGSGIAASLRAGTLLAKTVMADKDNYYTAETLWKYEVAYMKNIGFDYCTIAILKNAIPTLNNDDINFLFGSGILTNDDMTFSAEDSSVGAILSGFTVQSIIDRLKIANSNRALVKKVSAIGVNIVKFKAVSSSFPTKYNRQAVEKWAEKYKAFFDNTAAK